MKVVVFAYHYNYAGSSHRTSDGWFNGDYSQFGVLVFTTQKALSLKQNRVITNFIIDNYSEDNDNRSNGPSPPIFEYHYSKELSDKLANELLFDIIDEYVSDEIYSHFSNRHFVREIKINNVNKVVSREKVDNPY